MKYKHYSLTRLPERKPGLYLALFLLVCGMFPAALVNGQDKVKSTDSEQAETAATDATVPQPTELLNSIRAKLAGYETLRARVTETVTIGARRFAAKGRFLRASDNRLRLEFVVSIGESESGSLTQVCNGQLLWTRWQVGSKSQITRRDIVEIQRAVREAEAPPNTDLLSDLGMGGIQALLAAVENAMLFDSAQALEIDGHRFFLLQGKWKKDLLGRLGLINPELDEQLPPHIPDFVRIYVEAETLFPRRIMYLKRHPEKELVRPLVTLDFSAIELNIEVPDSEFEYEPPDDVQQVDDTKEFIERLTKPAANPEATGK